MIFKMRIKIQSESYPVLHDRCGTAGVTLRNDTNIILQHLAANKCVSENACEILCMHFNINSYLRAVRPKRVQIK